MGSSQARIEGVVDVGIIVISHCENPAKEAALDFLEAVLTGERKCVIPVTAFIGAYHILTRYLRIRREEAARELIKTLSLEVEAFYPYVLKELAIEAIATASDFNVEGWDGYLVSLARALGTSNIFTIDQRLSRVRGINVIIPIPEDVLRKYHEWVARRARR